MSAAIEKTKSNVLLPYFLYSIIGLVDSQVWLIRKETQFVNTKIAPNFHSIWPN